MQARVKADFPWRSVQSCAGIEFVKYEWRPVPPDREPEAEANPHLEIQKPKPVRKRRQKAVEASDEATRPD